MIDDESSGGSYLFVGFIEQDYYRRVLQSLSGGLQSIAVASHLPKDHDSSLYTASVDSHALHREWTVPAAFDDIEPATLDAVCLYRFESHKVLAMRTMDRVYLSPASVLATESYLLELLRYWLGFLEQLQPRLDAAFFTSLPHFPWDIVLDFALKERGVRRYYMRETPFDRVVYISRSMERSQLGLASLRVDFIDEEPFLAQMDPEEALDPSESRVVASMRAANDLVESPALPVLARRIAHVLRRRVRSVLRRQEASCPWPPYYYLTMTQYVLLLVRHFRGQVAAYRWLQTHALGPATGTPYVLFALHMQPERTTDPEAADFSQQYLALSLLSAALPEGMDLLVKEHPAQYAALHDLRKLHFKRRDLYAKISRIPRVRFAPIDSDSRELLASSVAVASCRGTILWESLVAGRPSLSFASTWHNNEDISPLCSSLPDVREALGRFSTMTPEHVTTQLPALLEQRQESFIRASFGDVQWRQGGQLDQDVNNLANALSQVALSEAGS